MSNEAVIALIAATVVAAIVGIIGFFLKGIAGDIRDNTSKMTDAINKLGIHEVRIQGNAQTLGEHGARLDALEKSHSGCLANTLLHNEQMATLKGELERSREAVHDLRNLFQRHLLKDEIKG